MEIKSNIYINRKNFFTFSRKKAKKCALGVDFTSIFWYNVVRYPRCVSIGVKISAKRKGEKYVRSSKTEYVEANSRSSS